jgi:hypothetical protein
MKPVFSTSEILVFDDFMSPEEMSAAWRLMQSRPLASVHGGAWNPAWKLGDGNPLRGDVIVSSANTFDPKNATYPTGTAIDPLIAKVRGLAATVESHLGKHGRDWTHFFARPYAYGAGSGLSWHRDNQKQVSGAFTYYCHPRWGAHWGGELMVADPGTKTVSLGSSQDARALFDTSGMDKHISDVGVGTYIFPKPNRLVVLCSGILHAIKKVDSAAGENVRATYQGFFFRATPDADAPRNP